MFYGGVIIDLKLFTEKYDEIYDFLKSIFNDTSEVKYSVNVIDNYKYVKVKGQSVYFKYCVDNEEERCSYYTILMVIDNKTQNIKEIKLLSPDQYVEILSKSFYNEREDYVDDQNSLFGGYLDDGEDSPYDGKI